jgi:hypothetical protein
MPRALGPAARRMRQVLDGEFDREAVLEQGSRSVVTCNYVVKM